MLQPLSRSELIRSLEERFPALRSETVDQAVRTLLEHMATCIVRGRRIEIRDFGAFSLRHYAARTRRNPKTGEAIAVGETSLVHFRPGKGLCDRVNGRQE
jgi:integration host factor subunit beta